MKLSVIVPVFNMEAENKLSCCMDSILAQTLLESYEIIAVDDKSGDRSLNILYAYEAQYPDKVKVVALSKNCKQGGAKNAGMALATGEWIGFVDSDDWIAPDMYEKLIQRAESTGADFAGCDYALTDDPVNPGYNTYIQNNEDDQTGVLDEQTHKKHILKPGSMVVKIYKHSVIKENNLCFMSGIFYEDNYAGPLWSIYFSHFERVPEALYFYRQVETSTTHFVNADKCRDRMTAMEALMSEVKDIGCYEIYKDEIDYTMIGLHYRNTLFSYIKNMRLYGSFKGYRESFIREIAGRFLNLGINLDDNPHISHIPQEEMLCMKAALKSPLLFWGGYACLSYWRKYRDIILYLIFGVLTTIVNFAVYNACNIFIFKSMKYYMISNGAAWVIAVLFAYITNRSVVFKSKVKGAKGILTECAKFVGARIASGAMDMALMWALVDMAHWNDNLSKLICQVMVTVANYVFSKVFIFKGNK